MDQSAQRPATPDPDPSPRVEYARRLEAASARAAALARRDDAGANVRLVLFLAVLVLGFLAARGSVGVAWPLVVTVVFAAAVIAHGRAVAARRRAEGVVAYHRAGLARLDGDWAGRGNPGTRFADEAHPYAADLDLFGRGSVFERLCLAQTAAGEDTLAGFLLRPADPGAVRDRQAAAIELRPRLDLREDLAFLAGDLRASGDPRSLAEWGATAPPALTAPVRWAVFALVAATVASLAAWLAGVLDPRPLLGLIVAECVVALVVRRRVEAALHPIAERGSDLLLLSALIARIEAERPRFAAPILRALGDRFGTGQGVASRHLRRLGNLVVWLEARHNTIFALLAALLLWKTQIGLAAAAWRAAHGPAIGGWLDAIGLAEALSSLAGYAYENPGDTFPDFAEPGPEGPVLEADGLAHPLLPADRAVRNDLRLGGPGPRVLAVSGSNMSGKSTWLRSVGANVVLAQAGAPARATRMRLSPLAVGGTLTVHDSLQEGRSRFYAEILRLRQLLDLAAGPRPLLFLIDEVLAGTNSHDRLQGAEAVVRGLLDRGAIGLFTTHDLALTAVADRLAPRARNVHFADHLDDAGRLAFDYRMQPGVVEHSNALALMRAVGLAV